jgi:hypothetical protein
MALMLESGEARRTAKWLVRQSRKQGLYEMSIKTRISLMVTYCDRSRGPLVERRGRGAVTELVKLFQMNMGAEDIVEC